MKTPYYQYDINALHQVLETANFEANKYGFKVHYAIKANSNPVIVNEVSKFGFGADCVSGNEIKLAISKNIPPNKIVFAGVGKTTEELDYAIENEISVINVESWEELIKIDELAKNQHKTVNVAFRITPDVDAYTHNKISTGSLQHKFGFYSEEIPKLLKEGSTFNNIAVIGLHFHIGSQIMDLNVFRELSKKVSEINAMFLAAKYDIKILNVGGGLGVDYNLESENSMPNFSEYFATFNKCLIRNEHQEIHFELGRSLVANCGSLMTSVLYTKSNSLKNFIIVDAGMTELIRPALYDSSHFIENLSSTRSVEIYDVAGPICETSDVFAESIQLNKCAQGDILKIHTTGAYGEVMASNYNLRENVKSKFITY